MQEFGWFRALSDDGQQFDNLELPAKKKEGSGLTRSKWLRTMDGKDVEAMQGEIYRIVESGLVLRRL